jgi:hypothetical protein
MRPSARPGPSEKRAAALDAGQHVIAVHGVAHRVAADEEIAVQIFSRRIRHDEAVTVAMRDQRRLPR